MFLDKIVAATKVRVENRKLSKPLRNLCESAEAMGPTGFPFEKALMREDIAFICEVKKASPSKGIIAEDFPYVSIAKEYEAAGAAAVSVLTEPDFFLGSDDYLKEISRTVSLPTLRKDFIIDSYQIYEARLLGASAVLLIAELLDEDTLRNYITTAHSLGLSALVESHSLEQMLKALSAGARIIGVNNRNLDTFEVDIQTSLRLREFVPKDVVFVSESGIATAEDIALLRRHRVNAVLIGEALMRRADKIGAIESLRGCGQLQEGSQTPHECEQSQEVGQTSHEFGQSQEVTRTSQECEQSQEVTQTPHEFGQSQEVTRTPHGCGQSQKVEQTSLNQTSGDTK